MARAKDFSVTERQKAIVNRWAMFEEDEPDISTERLMAMVCDSIGCDAGEVAEALHVSSSRSDPSEA